MLGKACTHSARLNQSLLPKKEFEALEDIARRCGAAGVQVAHSGNVAGILLDARSPDLARCLEWGTTLLAQYDMTATVVFRAGGNPQSGTCVASNSARAVRREGVGAGVRPHR